MLAQELILDTLEKESIESAKGYKNIKIYRIAKRN